MKENVGRIDRMARSIVAPTLIGLGYALLGGKRGKLAGLVTMMGGALLLESAVTRVCPFSALLGVDSRSERERLRDELALGPARTAASQRGSVTREPLIVTP